MCVCACSAATPIPALQACRPGSDFLPDILSSLAPHGQQQLTAEPSLPGQFKTRVPNNSRAQGFSSPRLLTQVVSALSLTLQAIPKAGTRLVELPRSCHLTYDESSDPRVLQLIQQVPEELWGAKLALQVGLHRTSKAVLCLSVHLYCCQMYVLGLRSNSACLLLVLLWRCCVHLYMRVLVVSASWVLPVHPLA